VPPVAPPSSPGLVPVHEAAAAVGRSVATLRAWVRAGRLEGTREPGPSGRLLVQLPAVLAVAAALDPDAGRAAPSHPGPAPAELEARTRAAAAEARAEALTEALLEARARAAAEARRADEARLDLAAARAELAGARAELEALRGATGLPWWRRLLPG